MTSAHRWHLLFVVLGLGRACARVRAMNGRLGIYVYVYVYACMYTRMHVCLFVCMYICMYVCISFMFPFSFRLGLSLYKILFHIRALVWESIILVFVLPPPHLQSLPYCNTIARLLRNIRPPTDPPFVCHTPYNIGGGNVV